MKHYINDEGRIVAENEIYIAINGDQFGRLYPKDEIPELHLINEVPKPDISSEYIITGYTVDEEYNQVWTVVEKNSEEYAIDLEQAKHNKMANLYQIFINATEADIEYTSDNDVTKIYQADARSVYSLKGMLETYKTETPIGFYWITLDNIKNPFTRNDLEQLAFEIGDRANTHFQHLQTLKDLVRECTTIEEVQAIQWDQND